VTRRLEIRCAGRQINPLNNQPYGRICGLTFTSSGMYRSRRNWIERARAAGWRVSPLQADKTVTACCPACSTGKKQKTTNQKG
jgi:hypothetical protein